jgi:hypothetical protein
MWFLQFSMVCHVLKTLMFCVVFFNINGIMLCESTCGHIPSTLCTRRNAVKVSREMVHSKLVSLALILSLCHRFIHKHYLHFQNISPFNLFLLSANSYIKEGTCLPHGIPNKIYDCACNFQSRGFPEGFLQWQAALLTVSSCKASTLKRAAWNNR